MAEDCSLLEWEACSFDPVNVTELHVAVPGGELVGYVKGDGPPVLLLHGGPGLRSTYMEDLVDELTPGYRIALYQQRSLAPSTTVGPFTVETHVADVEAVLDELGWSRAYVVGHSWGGYLMLAAISQYGDRFVAGVGVDSIGVIGDGGIAEFERAIDARTPPNVRERADELDQRALAGEATEAESLESFRLVWPAYFADPDSAPPMPELQISLKGYSETLASMEDGRSALASALQDVKVPILLMYGIESPIPATASTDLAVYMPYTDAEAIADVGHYLWMEEPGVVRTALDRLVTSVFHPL